MCEDKIHIVINVTRGEPACEDRESRFYLLLEGNVMMGRIHKGQRLYRFLLLLKREGVDRDDR